MPPATNPKRYRRPEIGEASGSNSRVPTVRRDWSNWTDGPTISSSAGPYASSPATSSRSAHRVDPARRDSFPVRLGETMGDDNSAGDEGLANQPFSRHNPLPPLEDITEDDEAQEREEAREQVSHLPETTRVKHKDFNGALEDGPASNDGSDESLHRVALADVPTLHDFELQGMLVSDHQRREREEVHDVSTSLPIPDLTMDIAADNEIVNDVCFDGDGGEGRGITGMGSWNNSSASLVPRQGVPLYRTNTMESIRSGLARASSRLGQTFANTSTLTIAFSYAPDNKFEYTLLQWCRTIHEKPSLRTAEIIKVDRYRQESGVRHRFLVFQLRRKGKPRDVFLRLDRLIDPRVGPLRFISTSGVTPANDRALLVADEGRAIRGNTPTNVKIAHEARLNFSPIRPPTLRDLRHVLNAIGLHMKKYRLSSQNCWLFCAICLEGLLKKFEGEFMTGGLEHFGLSAATDLRKSVYAWIKSTPH